MTGGLTMINLIPLFIILLLAVPLYFLFRRFLEKHNILSGRKRTYLLLLSVLLTAVVIYTVFVFGALQLAFYYPRGDFTVREWKEDPGNRYTLVDSLLKDHSLIGMTREDVIELLGSDFGESGSSLFYDIGYPPSIVSLEPDRFYVNFDRGKVISAGDRPLE